MSGDDSKGPEKTEVVAKETILEKGTATVKEVSVGNIKLKVLEFDVDKKQKEKKQELLKIVEKIKELIENDELSSFLLVGQMLNNETIIFEMCDNCCQARLFMTLQAHLLKKHEMVGMYE